MAAFETDQDVYNADALMDRESQYACYRWLSRVLIKAPRKEFYANWLSDLRIEDLPEFPKVILAVVSQEVPASRQFISADRLAILDSVKPLDPPVVLEEDEWLQVHPPHYEAMGLIV